MEINEALLSLLLTLASIGATAGAVYVQKWAKAKLSEQDYHLAVKLIDAAINAVEQTMKGEPGEEKLASAMTQAGSLLKAHGISLDTNLVTLIESSLLHKFK